MRRTLAFVAGLALAADVVLAVLWRKWCRDQGYAEQSATLLPRP